MKVMLVRPKPHKNSLGLSDLMTCEPLELEYVASLCKKLGHNVILVDMILEKKSITYFLKKYKPDVVGITGYIAHVNVIKEWCIILIRKYVNGDFKIGNNEGEPRPDSFVRGTPFCHAPCMVRREAYTAVSGYSVSDKRLRVEDWDLWVRMYAKGYKGYVYGEPLYKMRDDRNAFARRKFKYRFKFF